MNHTGGIGSLRDVGAEGVEGKKYTGANTCPSSLNMLSGKRELHFTRRASEREPDKHDVDTDFCCFFVLDLSQTIYTVLKCYRSVLATQ